MFICINDFTCLHSIASRREAGHGQYVPPCRDGETPGIPADMAK